MLIIAGFQNWTNTEWHSLPLRGMQEVNQNYELKILINSWSKSDLEKQGRVISETPLAMKGHPMSKG